MHKIMQTSSSTPAAKPKQTQEQSLLQTGKRILSKHVKVIARVER